MTAILMLLAGLALGWISCWINYAGRIYRRCTHESD